MPYSSRAVANYFLMLAENSKKTLTPMKLLKLVYYAHGWSLALHGKPLINEQVEAWKFGPVIPGLYHDLKRYGNQPILHRISDWRESGGTFVPYHPTLGERTDPDRGARDLVETVWNAYGDWSAAELSSATHEKGGPWDLVYQFHNGNPPRGTDIPQDSIQDYFTKLAKSE